MQIYDRPTYRDGTMRDAMNDPFRCDCCGKFISVKDFDRGATRILITQDTHFTRNDYETICIKCNNEYKEKAG